MDAGVVEELQKSPPTATNAHSTHHTDPSQAPSQRESKVRDRTDDGIAEALWNSFTPHRHAQHTPKIPCRRFPREGQQYMIDLELASRRSSRRGLPHKQTHRHRMGPSQALSQKGSTEGDRIDAGLVEL